MTELYWMCQSDNGSITGSHSIRQWSDRYIRSLEGIKDPRAPLRLQNLLSAAGLVEIEYKMIRLPLCGWSSGTWLSFRVVRTAEVHHSLFIKKGNDECELILVYTQTQKSAG